MSKTASYGSRNKMSIAAFFLIVCGVIWPINAQLYADDVSDGICSNVPVASNLTLCLPLITVPRVYGVYFGSEALFRNYIESFLGRPALNKTELDAICFFFAFVEALVLQSGYVTKSNIRTAVPTDLSLSPNLLNPLELGRFKINTTLAQSQGSTVANQYETIDSVVWCDSENVLIVRCVNGTRQDWKLGSIRYPEPWIFPLMLQKIQSYGMPTQNAVQYKSVSQGGICPDVPDLVSFTRQGLSNVGLLPLSLGNLLSGLATGLGPLYSIAGLI